MLNGICMRRLNEYFAIIMVSMMFAVFGCGNSETGGESEFIHLKVDGMTWTFSCVPAVQSALAEVNGVKNAEVVLEGGKASVTVEKGKVDAKQLEQAVASIQGGHYKAKAQ